MKRCIYCNKETESDIEVEASKKYTAKKLFCCNEECHNKAEQFYKNHHYFKLIFIPTLIIFLIVCILSISNILHNLFLLSIIGCIIGGLFILFPYRSTYSAETWGIKKSMILLRISGVFFLLFSIKVLLAEISYIG